MEIIAELSRRAALLALWFVVALRVVVGEALMSTLLRIFLVEYSTRNFAGSPLTTPRGLEWRTIKRLPAGKIVALRLQVVIA